MSQVIRITVDPRLLFWMTPSVFVLLLGSLSVLGKNEKRPDTA